MQRIIYNFFTAWVFVFACTCCDSRFRCLAFHTTPSSSTTFSAIAVMKRERTQLVRQRSYHTIPRIDPPSVQAKYHQTRRMMMLTEHNEFLTNILIASETEAWVKPLSNVLDPFLNFMSFAMLARVVLSWYPEIISSQNSNGGTSNSNVNDSTSTNTSNSDASTPSSLDNATPTTISESTDGIGSENANSTTTKPTKVSLPIWITAIVIPTQPLLQIVKGVVPPAFGVDITPVFWLAIFTFVHEILLGQQGLLTMKIRYGI
jgi:uncharacterized protein YggT (Ycf19 family)